MKKSGIMDAWYEVFEKMRQTTLGNIFMMDATNI